MKKYFTDALDIFIDELSIWTISSIIANKAYYYY